VTTAARPHGCANCEDARWVCETHTNKPWPHGCNCSAGAPCPVCSSELGQAEAIQNFLARSDREDLNALKSTPVGGEPENELDHFMVCPECGQAFDMRRLGDALHHNEPGHKPLPTNA
jgi:hypothetical protein